MRPHRHLPLLLVGVVNCGGFCVPEPTPPPADSCDNAVNVGLRELEVGPDTQAVFLPWPVDGSHAALNRGGQGLTMLGVRMRFAADSPASCVAQRTSIHHQGQELTWRNENLVAYADAGRFTTHTLWLVLNDDVPEGDTLEVQVISNGRSLTRSLVAVPQVLLPTPLGVQPARVCANAGLSLRAGVSLPAPPGTVLMAHAEGALTGASQELLVTAGQGGAAFPVQAGGAGSAMVRVHGVAETLEVPVTVVAETAPALAFAEPEVTLEPGGTGVVRLSLSCAAAAVVSVTLVSSPPGVLRHATAVTFVPGMDAVDVEVAAPQSAVGSTFALTANGPPDATINVVVEGAGVARTGLVVLDEVFLFPPFGTPKVDATCDNSVGAADAFFELFNAGTTPAPLAGLTVNAWATNGTSSVWMAWTDGVLGPGQRLTVLGSDAATSGSTAPWCQTLSQAHGGGHTRSAMLPTDNPMRVTLEGATGVIQEMAPGLDGEGLQSLVWTSTQAVAHARAAGHAVDRPVTPGGPTDGAALVAAP